MLAQTSTRRDGNWWRDKSEVAKLDYMTGIFDGMDFGHNFTLWGIEGARGQGSPCVLALRRLAHDPQGILTAVYGLAIVSIKLIANTRQCCIWVGQSLSQYSKLSVTAFADAERWGLSRIFYDPQFALRHDCSLTHLVGRA